MKIIIDSTHFKKDLGLNKEDLALIKDLGKYNLIELHIPWFVYQETSSSSIATLTSELSTIKNSLKSFNRKGMSADDYKTSIDLSFKISKLIRNAKQSNEELWENFVRESNATLHAYDDKESIKVFEAYFSAGKPFKSLKSRDDIPDAFIYQTIEKIASSASLYLISGDGNLGEKSSQLKNVTVYKEFSDLYKTEEFEKIKIKYDKLNFSQKIEDSRLILLDNKENIDEAVRQYCTKIENLVFEDFYFQSDDNEGTIYAIDEPIVTIEESEIKFIDDKFYVPITVNALASLDYSVFKADYWLMEDMPSISEDLNKHYYLIEETLPIIMRKTVSIDISEIKEDEELQIEIDGFDEIEIDRAQL